MTSVVDAGNLDQDLLLCPDSLAHVWVYQGRTSQQYYCSRCAVRVSKRALKEATDA